MYTHGKIHSSLMCCFDASLTFNTGNFTLSNGGEIDLTMRMPL